MAPAKLEIAAPQLRPGIQERLLQDIRRFGGQRAAQARADDGAQVRRELPDQFRFCPLVSPPHGFQQRLEPAVFLPTRHRRVPRFRASGPPRLLPAPDAIFGRLLRPALQKSTSGLWARAVRKIKPLVKSFFPVRFAAESPLAPTTATTYTNVGRGLRAKMLRKTFLPIPFCPSARH